jgi:hypothetical protein
VASLGGALITSYLRARAEHLMTEVATGWVGRSERVIIFCVGVVSGRIGAMLWVMAVLTWLTVAQRFAPAWRKA